MNEVEVCYLERKQFKARKWKEYPTTEEAMEIFTGTINKFKNNRTEALVTVRIFERGLWRIYKTERV